MYAQHHEPICVPTPTPLIQTVVSMYADVVVLPTFAVMKDM